MYLEIKLAKDVQDIENAKMFWVTWKKHEEVKRVLYILRLEESIL